MKKIFFSLLFFFCMLYSNEIEEGMKAYKSFEYEKAYSILSKHINEDNPKVLYRLAYLQEQGLGTNKNIDKSRKNFEKAYNLFLEKASIGDSESMDFISSYYYFGIVVEKDLKKYIDWLIKAANAGNSSSMYYLGYAYQEGEGVNKDINLAIKWYEKASKKGEPYASHNLAFYYEDQKNQKESNKLYQLAFNQYNQKINEGDLSYLIYLADMYAEGMGVDKNISKAFTLYTKASKLEDFNSQKKFLEIMNEPLGKFFHVASRNYINEKLALKNDLEGMLELADYYGFLLKQENNNDLKLGLQKNQYYWYKKASSLDNDFAKEKLSQYGEKILSNFKNVEVVDFKNYWFHKVLECEEEIGVSKRLKNVNIEKCLNSITYIEKIKNKSLLQLNYLGESYFNAGIIYQFNEKYLNHKKAFNMYKKSYDIGYCNKDTECPNGRNLGYYYSTGEGGNEKNLILSYKYFKEAAEKGNSGASRNLEYICSKFPWACK